MGINSYIVVFMHACKYVRTYLCAYVRGCVRTCFYILSCFTGDSSGITYILSSNPVQYFSIDRDTGAIKTTQVAADREQHHFLLLSVQAEKDGVFGSAQVRLILRILVGVWRNIRFTT